jgi:hypothetical protein
MRLSVIVALISMLPGVMCAGDVGHTAAARMSRRDQQNHSLVRPKVLARPRTVNRYTTLSRAMRELRLGLPPNTHMTSKARPGRPLAASKAQRRYGLPNKPQVRETIQLPSGTTLRHNRAVGGNRGIGEVTSPKRVPNSAIRKVVPLKR